MDELELELVLLEWTLSKFWTLIFGFLRRSFLLPHFVVGPYCLLWAWLHAP